MEKLDLVDELEAAIAQVFPEGAGFTTVIARDFAPSLPPLLMQSAAFEGGARQHLEETPGKHWMKEVRITMDG